MFRKKKTYAPFALARETLSKIRINLSFLDLDKNIKCMMITSAVPGEGKSFLTANLAKSFASDNKRVLVIDADMRHASQQEYFRLDNRNGLSGCIASCDEWKKCLNRTATAGLYVLAAGRTPPDPAAMLASAHMKALLEEMRQQFDYILIDTPPVLSVPDAVALTRYSDAVLLVTRWGKTPKQAVTDAKRILALANAPLLGAVLNNSRPLGGYYHNYN
ncbi:MAG: CpsD/CapB family tyrosine-protein kinase [Clostridia bacterium]|nr:CpsD/CapB family tyrosine-protein kinase [Clostridia bacterium]